MSRGLHSTPVVPRAGPQDDPQLIAGRYEFLERLDLGGTSRVWHARDLLTHEAVAVKVLPPLESDLLLALRSEVSALRLLHLPGVARLRDEGMEGERPFVVTDLAEGCPFPGAGLKLTWTSIRDTVIALLETLARVHAAGIVHRDLKPSNVLVDATGRPLVLDFGLSAGRAIGTGIDPDHRPVGTAFYVAPEQICGELTDARADLYSLGVMIWEVLAARGPQEGKVADEILQQRLHEAPPPLRTVAPHVPDDVAETIDRLVAPDRSARPRLAAEVLRRLRGETIALAAEQALPRLGGSEPVDAIVALARAGRSADLVGVPGSGRTRVLEEVSDVLESEGAQVIWIEPRPEPFRSLDRLGEWIEVEEPETLEHALHLGELLLRRMLEDGAVLLIDDWGEVDRWSAVLLRRSRESGCVIVARTEPGRNEQSSGAAEVVRLRDLREEELRVLFGGPDRLFHKREDGARELWRRTGGNPALVAEEIAAWVRAGLAEWWGSRLVVDRPALDRLRTGLQVRPPSAARAHATVFSANLEELLAWIALAFSRATPELLGKLLERPPWMIDAELAELLEAGAVHCTQAGGVELLVSPRLLVDWTDARRRAAHRLIADFLEPGDEGRLYHIVASGELQGISTESIELARSLSSSGRIGEAQAALTEGLQGARRAGDTGLERAVFRAWIRVALLDFTSLALDRVLYELSRCEERDAEILHLEQLVHAALSALESPGEQALDEIEAVPPFADLELERCRQARRVLAARGCSEERVSVLERELGLWAERHPTRRVRASHAEWRGLLAYRRDRYAEAAEYQAHAASLCVPLGARLSTMLNGASALLEASRFDEVIETASHARDLAAACRHTLYETRAEWLLRAAAYRRADPLAPDMELVEATAFVGARNMEALVGLNEAAVAWRRGELPRARELANHAAQCWSAAGKVWAGLLARSLALASGETPDPDELEDIAQRAWHCPNDDIAGQTIALLRGAGAQQGSHRAELADRLRRAFPSETRSDRREVLSIAEVLDALRAD